MDDDFKQLRDLILERDSSLRGHLDEQFAQIDKDLDKRFTELDKRFNEIDKRFNEMRDYVDERFSEMRDYVDERSRDIETRMLTEFHKWATRIESTIRPLPLRMGGHEERIALIEERMKGLDNPIF